MSGYRISPATSGAQALAADPAVSVFVAANAGSGKTHVLTERVARLLLAGAEPSRILCLTYTKAAAAEMSNRVFRRLAGWATADAATLGAELERLDGRTASPTRLAEARRLFAEALESPGGLKIQTIHAFCEAILHQFPLEANIPGHFEVLDDTESALLLAEARRLLIAGSHRGAPDKLRLADAFAAALDSAGEWGLDRLLEEIVRKRDAIRRHVEEAGGLDAATNLLRSALGLAEGEDEASLMAGLWPCTHLDPDLCRKLLDQAGASDAPTDRKLAERLALLLDPPSAEIRLQTYRALVLDSKGAVRATLRGFATKAVVAGMLDLEERLRRAGERAQTLCDRLATVRLARASAAALVIADRLERDYAELKRRRGRLDFEDLIVRTADLLTRAEASAWVHYKLDQGIDHVLIDEAQDTSPRQWQVVRALADEFFTGFSARNRARTVFAVGDEKQSIYSFQGASPAMFGAERRSLGQRAEAAGARFAQVRLHQSFRSVEAILHSVDRVFAQGDNRRGLSFGDEAPVHETARGEEPGLVEVWPALQAERTAEPEDWLQPVDVEPENSPANRLARRIARQIGEWLGQPLRVKGETRPLSAGDVLILVRKRSGFVGAMGSALRKAGIPVAGADRLVITDHIAVQDLMALGRVAANAEDELSLAAVLKSPFFGFTDDELMALALSRDGGEPLYLALRRLAGSGGEARVPDFVPAAERQALLGKATISFEQLETLRARSGFESVFSFYARLLGPEGGRAALTARLGRDAGEVIDAFLDLALAEEETGQPGLDAFLANLEAAPPEIKREMDHGKGEVRIMTVHASKGLEAPVVFLVDPGSAPFSHIHGARLMPWNGMPGLRPDMAPGFLWRADKSCENAVVEALKEEEKQRAEEEYRRLLYVGMTRAADRLVVCGIAGTRGPHPDSWLQRVEAALGEECEDILDEAGETVARRFGHIADPQKLPAVATMPAAVGRVLDLSALPPEPLAPRPLTPSSAGGAHQIETPVQPLAGPAGKQSPVFGGAGEPSFAIRRGLVIHRLLQELPDLAEDTREAAGRRYLDGVAADFPLAEREAALASVLAILRSPEFAPIFAPTSRAEVAVNGRLALGGRAYSVSGTIDRVAVSGEAVLIIDYKTNRPAPRSAAEVPPAYILQLALYREILKPLYPGKPVRAALLFTEGPRLIPLNDAGMDAALEQRALAGDAAAARAPRPDGPA